MTVTSIWVFYKNDLPPGFGFGFGFEDPEIVPVIVELLESGLTTYDKNAKPGDVELFFSQLDELARITKTMKLSSENVVIAMQIVHWLEQRGYMRPDEYNGLQIVQQI